MKDIFRASTDCAFNFDNPLDQIATALIDPGYLYLEDAIQPSFIQNLTELLEEKERADALTRAGIGKGLALEVRSEIRSDSIFWLEPQDPSPVVVDWLALMETISQHLRRALFLPLESYEGHLARYPEGGFYKPHLDQHRISPTRQVTIIAYLNPDWSDNDGGQLRLYTDLQKGIRGPSIDFLPHAGSIIIFRSADFWHEVLPAARPRMSLTGWLRGREDNPLITVH
ncbi:2OG-Fe(II) oxygenase [Rubritalea spongiae]|uniref:2OG-Fe(II) oxygenase n=1 Tax=Rubritalea spongiae TaxID=430797 RepID=A0ABW5E5X0_9BACT